MWYTWKNEENRKLYLVPVQLRKTFLSLAHDNTIAGHMGIEKTKERLRRNFFWPTMSADVEKHVKACAACNRSKHLCRKSRAPLQSFTTGAPMEKCHMDILGPLPESRKGNKYVLLMVDQFTKWVEAAPLPDQTAETVARAVIDHLFSRPGCPWETCTDQGANLTSPTRTTSNHVRYRKSQRKGRLHTIRVQMDSGTNQQNTAADDPLHAKRGTDKLG